MPSIGSETRAIVVVVVDVVVEVVVLEVVVAGGAVVGGASVTAVVVDVDGTVVSAGVPEHAAARDNTARRGIPRRHLQATIPTMCTLCQFQAPGDKYDI